MLAHGSLVNTHELNNFGGSNVYGILSNQGTFNNTGSLSLSNMSQPSGPSGGTLDNGHVLINTGTVTNEQYGTLNNSGTLVNKYVEGESSGNLYNYGVLTNNGTLQNEVEGGLHNGGKLTNENLIENFGTLSNSGELINNSNIINDGFFWNTGAFKNNGDFSGEGYYLQTAGTTYNYGMMTHHEYLLRGGVVGGKKSTFYGNIETGGGSVQTDWTLGNSPGEMIINGDLTSFGANFFFEIAGLIAGEEYDVLEINGNANFDGGLIRIVFLGGFLPGLEDTFEFLRVSGDITGWDSLKWMVSGLDGYEWAIRGGDGGLIFDITEVPGTGSVPEPGTYGLVLTALGLMGFMSRRRKALAS